MIRSFYISKSDRRKILVGVIPAILIAVFAVFAAPHLRTTPQSDESNNRSWRRPQHCNPPNLLSVPQHVAPTSLAKASTEFSPKVLHANGSWSLAAHERIARKASQELDGSPGTQADGDSETVRLEDVAPLDAAFPPLEVPQEDLYSRSKGSDITPLPAIGDSKPSDVLSLPLQSVLSSPVQAPDGDGSIAPLPPQDESTLEQFALPIKSFRSKEPKTREPSSQTASDKGKPKKLTAAEMSRMKKALAPVEEQAARLTRRAFSLGQRGATFAARNDMIGALRKIAQALDAFYQTNWHTQSLSQGLRAMKEADDFALSGAALDGDINLPLLVGSHKTPLLKDADLKHYSVLAASRQYLTYAQDQLAEAGGSSSSASFALYGLGRLQAAVKQDKDNGLAEPQAMVYHQAALKIDSRNHLAANELAVLLGRYGQFDDAKKLLLHSLRLRPTGAAWRNLAHVHHQKGEINLARRAQHEASLLRGNVSVPRTGGPTVRWMAPQDFTKTAKR